MDVNALIASQYDERKISILAGVEEIAKRINGIWYVKTAHCVRCGECCKRLPAHWKHGLNEEGVCKFLKKDSEGYVCTYEFPLGCVRSDAAGTEYCSVIWEAFNGI